MGPLHKRAAGGGGTHNNKLLFPLLSNKDKFSRHLSNKQSGWGGTRPELAASQRRPRLAGGRVCSFALPPGALRPSRAKKGRRRCHSRAPRPVATPAGPADGRDLQAPGRAAPGEEGGDRQGLPHPARSPGTREPCRRPGSRTCRPAPPRRPAGPLRSSDSGSRDSQLQPLVGRRRHRAPLAPSSSFRPPRPAPPPPTPRYSSPSSAAAAPGSPHPSPRPARPPVDGRRPWTNLVGALESAKAAVQSADWSAPKSAVTYTLRIGGERLLEIGGAVGAVGGSGGAGEPKGGAAVGNLPKLRHG